MAQKRPTVMTAPTAMELVAEAEHRMWCDAMKADGWKAGDVLDEDAKVHPGLRPFDELSEFDRDLICNWVRQSEVEWTLCEAVDSAFRNAEWSARDLRVGLRVSVLDHETRGPAADVAGSVIDWEVANPKSGRIASIRVKWDDGSVEVYPPARDYLVPIDA